MANNIGPLNDRVPIVGPDGRPTPEFMLKWRQLVEFTLSASQISYDNTASGLTATNVQDAIDELKTLIP